MKSESSPKQVEVAEIFDEVLVAAGFRRLSLGKSNLVGWVSWSWSRNSVPALVEKVELLVRDRGLKEAVANQLVFLETNDGEVLVDGRGIYELYSAKGSIDLQEGIFGLLSRQIFRNRLTKALRSSLSWFENYGSFDACRSRIESGQTNLGAGEATSKVLKLLGG